jgi:S1-C subfamily serine protease
VSKVVEDLLKYGTVQRGYLGIVIRNVDGNLAEEKDLNITYGAYVDSIAANSAAGDAGVKVGDVIKEIDGVTVKNSASLLEIVGRHRPGDKVNLKIDRKGKEIDFVVTLRNEQGKEKITEKDSQEILEILGVELEEIDKNEAEKLNIDGGLQIVQLYDGLLKQNTSVEAGFIITKVDGRKVKTIDDFVKYLENRKGGVMLEGIYEDFPGTYYYAFGL